MKRLILILLPTTLALGSLALWAWSRSFVQIVDDRGVTLRSGRFVAWRDVQSLLVLKQDHGLRTEAVRIDIRYPGGTAHVIPKWLENGAEVMDAVKAHMRKAPPSGRA